MTIPECDLVRRLEEFRCLLNRTLVVGVSRIGELSQLQVLVRKYPAEARQMLGELADPTSGDEPTA
ncbi:hypothetical protein [Actinoallomurus sp. NPDC052274]|uniref:hypothetical protein n=1 Tax=Actinoallomurus sp. NPDC052274 TaxID=3155420 RepID=UPI00341277E1